MLERTLARPNSTLSAGRLRSRSFYEWSGAALSRFFRKGDKDESRPESSRRQKELSIPSSDEEMTRRREQLQELLQRVNAERTHKEKMG